MKLSINEKWLHCGYMVKWLHIFDLFYLQLRNHYPNHNTTLDLLNLRLNIPQLQLYQ